MNTNDNRLKAHKLIDHIFQDLLPAHGMAQRPEQIQLSHRMLDMLGHYSAGFTLDTYAYVTTDAQLKAAQTMGNKIGRAHV